MSVRILVGDARQVLADLADDSVHQVVTSPPYFMLRDYQTGEWQGGNADCDHVQLKRGARSTIEGGNFQSREIMVDECRMCGATRHDRQIGLESTPEAYVDALVDLFEEVRRVLRPDGTLWLNISDTYASAGGLGRQGGSSARAGRANIKAQMKRESTQPPPGYHRKELIGIPWMLAFAMRRAGWMIRQEIIWSKPNPMPESTKDRCTKAHESLFIFTKTPRYFYDWLAIAEPAGHDTKQPSGWNTGDGSHGNFHPDGREPGKRGSGNVARKSPAMRDADLGTGNLAGSVPWEGSIRNKRSVWTIATEPYPEAHFATYPTTLIEPAILAGTSVRGCCQECGAPWHRVVEKVFVPQADVSIERGMREAGQLDDSSKWSGSPRGTCEYQTTGWKIACSCNAPAVPCTVLDPFGGAGTTGLVAERLQRNAILIELNPKYAAMARRRIRDDLGKVDSTIPEERPRGGLFDLLDAAE